MIPEMIPREKLPLLGALSPDTLPPALSGDLPMTDILDIKPSIPLEGTLLLLPWVAGTIALLLLAALVLWRYLRKKRFLPEAPDPGKEAETRLRQLMQAEKMPLRERYFEVALILRLGLEARLLRGAREKTLEEIRAGLQNLPEAPEMVEELFPLLRRLGEVQFHNRIPSEEEFYRHAALLEKLLSPGFCAPGVSEEKS